MSKEHEAYRFFIMIYVVFIVNCVLLLFESVVYYLLFLSSIIILLILCLVEIKRMVSEMKHFSQYKVSLKSFYLIVFLLCYPEHYMPHLRKEFVYIFLLQLLNILLFTLAFCFEEKVQKN